MQRLKKALFVLGILVVLGTSVYQAIEHMSFLDALYMTIITLSTVGFGEVQPLSPTGKLFTIGLIIIGVSSMAWAASSVVEVILGEQLQHALWKRHMKKAVDQLRGHYIICGYGRMGQQIGNELARRQLSFVAIEREPQILELLRKRNVLFVEGDAARDATLLAAGIKHAQGLAAALSGDADNALIVISAKGLNPLLQVVARASNRETEEKLLRAGADRVVTPYTIGGQRMALSLLQPAVNEFLSSVIFDEEKYTELGEVRIREGSFLIGKSLKNSRLREQWGATVVAIKSSKGEFSLSPPASTLLQSGDLLIVVANAQNLRLLQSI